MSHSLLILNNSHFCCCLSVPCEFCIIFAFTLLQSSPQRCRDWALSVRASSTRKQRVLVGNKKSEKMRSKPECTWEARWSVNFTAALKLLEFLKGTQNFKSINSVCKWATEVSSYCEPGVYLAWRLSLAAWLQGGCSLNCWSHSAGISDLSGSKRVLLMETCRLLRSNDILVEEDQRTYSKCGREWWMQFQVLLFSISQKFNNRWHLAKVRDYSDTDRGKYLGINLLELVIIRYQWR